MFAAVPLQCALIFYSCRRFQTIMSAKPAVSRRQTMADKADIHELYEKSVQNVEHEVEFLQATFQQIRDRKAYVFREDFCGTASASCEWVKQGNEFQSFGVDIDSSVLEWGRKNRVGRLSAAEQARVQLLEADVMSAETPPADLLAAFNFSYFIFDTRDQLREYFNKAYAALKDDGVFFVDLFGGPEAQEETREKTKHKRLDGSKIKKAFTYEWRLWSAPEIREILAEAGFKKSTLYWEGEDEDGDGNGEFTPEEKGEADLAWIAYIVAEK
jgi:SAM-dependent methyltransferase